MLSAHFKGGFRIHRDRPKGLLIVRRIINLTDHDLTFYNQFGEIVTLRPEKLKLHNGRLPIIGDGTYIVVDDSVDKNIMKMIKEDKYYARALVTPHSIGRLKGGIEGYHLVTTGPTGRSFFVTTANEQQIPAVMAI